MNINGTLQKILKDNETVSTSEIFEHSLKKHKKISTASTDLTYANCSAGKNDFSIGDFYTAENARRTRIRMFLSSLKEPMSILKETKISQFELPFGQKQ